MAYVNEVKQGSKVFEVRDKRIGEVTADDNGKVLAVGVDGTLGFKTPSNPVTANPTLEGGETNLNSIQIGEQKYKVAGFTINTTSGTTTDEELLNFICVDNVDYYVDYHIYNGYVLNANIANKIICSHSEMNVACYYINYGLETLGLTDRVGNMGQIVSLWEKYQENQNFAFLLMGLILVAFNEAGIELKDSHGNAVKYYVVIDQANPTNSTMTQYVMTEDTSNGYELKYVGTHYTIADTATIMGWTFGID